MKRKRAIVEHKTKRKHRQDRVYFIVFMPEPSLYRKQVDRYLDFLKKLFNQKDFKQVYSGVSKDPPVRYESLFVPKEKSSKFEKTLISLGIPLLFLKIEKSTKEEVITHFEGNKKFSFWVTNEQESIFEWLFLCCMGLPSKIEGEITGVYSTFELGKYRRITIKKISKQGIRYFKELRKFLKGNAEKEKMKKPDMLTEGKVPLLKG